MAYEMYRDCMNLLDEVRTLSLGAKSPAGKALSKNREKREFFVTSTPDERRKRPLEDTPVSSSKRRKR